MGICWAALGRQQRRINGLEGFVEILKVAHDVNCLKQDAVRVKIGSK